MRFTNRQTPLHIQITNDLLTKLKYGELLPNSKIATENTLAKEYNVSRPTVRQALATIEQQGLIYRRQGSGTYLSDNILKFRKEQIRRSKKNIFMGEDRFKVKVLKRNGAPASKAVANVLGIAPGDEIYFLQRIISVKGKQIAFFEDFMLPEYGALLKNEALEDNGVLNTLRFDHNVKIEKLTHTISVKRADEKIWRALKIPPLNPMLAFDTVIFLSDGTPMELLQSYFVEDRYQYIVDEKDLFSNYKA